MWITNCSWPCNFPSFLFLHLWVHKFSCPDTTSLILHTYLGRAVMLLSFHVPTYGRTFQQLPTPLWIKSICLMTVYMVRSDLAPSVSLLWASTTLPILSSALSTLILTSGLCICSSACLKCFPQDLCMSYLLLSFRSLSNCCCLRETFVDHPDWNSSPPPCTLKAALALQVVIRHWAFCYRYWRKKKKPSNVSMPELACPNSRGLRGKVSPSLPSFRPHVSASD